MDNKSTWTDDGIGVSDGCITFFKYGYAVINFLNLNEQIVT